jgi:vitamin B12 transporter
VTVIDAQEIKERGVTQALDVLREVPGVDVVRSGGLGGNTAVFIRGANSEHTLVLLDGVPINNPISNARFFNFSSFTLDEIERVEVVRGPQSTLYGSNALGGVINIITKRGQGPVKGSVSVEAGSQNTMIERGAISGGNESINYSAAMLRQDTDGVSAADSRLGNEERDGFHNLGFSSRVGFSPDKNQEISLAFRTQHSTADLDAGGGVSQDDPNRMIKNKQYFIRGEAALSFFDERIKPTFGAAYVDEEFTDNDDPDQLRADLLRSRYRGSRLKFDMQQQLTLVKGLDLLLGAETEEERGDSDYLSVSSFGPYEARFSERTARHNGYFAQIQGEAWEVFYPTAGVRLDTNSGYGTELTWRTGPTVLLKESGTKIFGTVGTGFKSPSLYQRFSDFGDPELDAEHSTGVDAGLEQELLEQRLFAGTTYFYNNFDDLIDFDPNSFKFMNIEKARTEGLESFVEGRFSEQLSLRGNYTLTNTLNRTTYEELLRRARHKLGAQLRYQPVEGAVFRIDLLYVGARADTDFSTYPATPVTLGGYTTVNLSGNFNISEGVEIFTRIENLFDRNYQEVFGFGTPGLSAFGGVRVNL